MAVTHTKSRLAAGASPPAAGGSTVLQRSLSSYDDSSPLRTTHPRACPLRATQAAQGSLRQQLLAARPGASRPPCHCRWPRRPPAPWLPPQPLRSCGAYGPHLVASSRGPTAPSPTAPSPTAATAAPRLGACCPHTHGCCNCHAEAGGLRSHPIAAPTPQLLPPHSCAAHPPHRSCGTKQPAASRWQQGWALRAHPVTVAAPDASPMMAAFTAASRL